MRVDILFQREQDSAFLHNKDEAFLIETPDQAALENICALIFAP
jgi:hypothetical protein